MLLIISSQKRTAKSLVNIFRMRGLITKYAKPMDALRHTSTSLSAILLLMPEELSDAEGYMENLRAVSFGTPIFAITKHPFAIPCMDAFTEVIDMNIGSNDMLNIIQTRQKKAMCRLSGEYRLFDIDASISKKNVTYREQEVSLTRKEKAILRYLICSYPEGCQADKIAFDVYKQESVPEPSCIRAHICGINRKFRTLLGRPLILSSRGEGYRIDKASLTTSAECLF